jgi:hypothetical protein
MLAVIRRFMVILLAVLAGVVGLIAVGGFALRQPSLQSLDCSLEDRADPERLEAHVRFLATEAVPRDIRHPETIGRAVSYIAEAFASSGGRVERQPYTATGLPCTNIIATYGPEGGDTLVVGAHYDAFGGLPGADDNASGVAGLLEVARLLGQQPPQVRVELVAYSTEEPPFFGGPEMGSAVHARRMTESGTPVAGMICLEMIGYFTRHQPSPHWIIGLIYPRRGDFVVVVGRWQDRWLAGHVKAGCKGAGGVRTCSFTGPPILGADLSDHRSYWRAGYTAVMVTDTAYIRNPSYHTRNDRPETLDYRKMASVVDGVTNAILQLPRARTPG